MEAEGITSIFSAAEKATVIGILMILAFVLVKYVIKLHVKNDILHNEKVQLIKDHKEEVAGLLEKVIVFKNEAQTFIKENRIENDMKLKAMFNDLKDHINILIQKRNK